MHKILTLLAALLGVVCMVSPQAQTGERASVRVAVLQFGTVNWELDVIEAHGLATKEGVDLEIVKLGSTRATSVALQGGAADVIVTDWVWVSRQRHSGRRFSFVPYSTALGSVMVRPQAGITSLEALRGQKLGIAGGPVDKSWLLLRAATKRDLGTDLASWVEPTFAAPPLLNELLLRDELPAVLNYWHYSARLRAAGMNELVSMEAVLRTLGITVPLPMIGWVFDETWAESNVAAITGFLRASLAAKRILLESDAEWVRLEPMLKVSDARGLRELRDAYRAGIPRRFDAVQRQAVERVYEILVKQGGAELVGPNPTLAPGTFWTGFDLASW